MRLLDKRAIVVGAGQTPGDTIGNGRAIATLFARQGAQVLCVDRAGERAQSVAMEIGGVAFAGDVTDAGVCKTMVAEAQKQFGGVDIVVNNVGIGGGGDGPAHLADEAAFDHIIDVNLKAAWLVIKSALPALRESHGAIVNISSLASLAGANMIAYELSKAALNRLTLSVALSNAKHGVRCNAILPGLMDTPMAIAGVAAGSGKSLAEVRAARSARVPLNGKMGDAWDTANAALFLASEEAKFITGALLPVDGGMSARVG
jgi:NAD(P)-dependent dehydrogenase (short-subunit alcohol dehydrogenase family)